MRRKRLLNWTDSNNAKGPSGTIYGIWSESYAGRHGDRHHLLQVWNESESKWTDVPDTMRDRIRDVKALAERIEQRKAQP